jgi:hypothetical protein
MEPIAKFQAIIADSSAALKCSNEGQVRIMFDLDESQFPEAFKVVAFGKERLLTITVEASE